MSREIEVMQSSGNVFADLDLPNPEERLAKAMLSRHISQAIRARRLTESQAARGLDTTPTRVADVVRGQLSRTSIDELFRFLRALGMNVRITVTPDAAGDADGHITVDP